MNSGKTMLKITRCLYCMLLCFLFFFTMPLAEAAKASTETRAAFPAVLMYHDIKTRPLNNFDVTREDFCAQLDWLKQKGYRTLSMEEFIDGMSKQSFPKRAF